MSTTPAGAVDGDYLVDVLTRSIAYESPLTDRAEADDRVVGFLREVLAPELEDAGCDEVAFDPMGNVLGRMGGGDGPGLLLVVFAMTHPAASMEAAFTPRVVDGAAYGESGPVVVGRGAGEQKGPMASVLAAVRALGRSGERPSRPVHVVGLVSGETGRHDAIRSAMAHFAPDVDGAVVAVCTGNDVVVRHKGRVDIEVVVRGRAAHSSSPWLGVSALEGARLALDRIGTIDPGDPDPGLGPRTITATALETWPKASHTVPDRARIVVDRRLLPGDTPDGAVEALREAIGDVGPCEVEVRAGDHMHPSEVPHDARIVRSLSEAVAAETGTAPRLLEIAAATDSGYLNHVGIPAVLFGPGDLARAHTDSELVPVGEAVTTARALARMAAS